MLMVDEAPNKFAFVYNNRSVAEAAEERELAMQYWPMVQLKDTSNFGREDAGPKEDSAANMSTSELAQELTSQLRKMHMYKKYEFTVKDGQTHQAFALDNP
jgi:hypothetical protein